jgi:hypothetical protein
MTPPDYGSTVLPDEPRGAFAAKAVSTLAKHALDDGGTTKIRSQAAMTAFKSDFLRALDERGLIHQVSNPEELDKLCRQGPQTAYVGYDCDRDQSLHVGQPDLSIMMLLAAADRATSRSR